MYIKEMDLSDKPRERAKLIGFNNLTTIELLALIIRSGTINSSVIDIAKQIMDNYKSLSVLRSCTLTDLNKISGMGEAKSISLLAAIELASRIKYEINFDNVTKIVNAKDIFNYMKRFVFNTYQEEFYVIGLNIKKEVTMSKLLFKGNIDKIVINPRDIFKYVLENNCKYVIFAHNHPTRNIIPSKADLDVTSYLIKCSKILQIKVLDHIIFSDISYSSLYEDNYMTFD